ncbi:MAG: hypothetical protein ACNA8G_09060 [Gammaproteobacteria bacterium]
MASLVKRLAGRMGYELKKKYGTLPPLDFLETLLLGALAVDGRLNVVQVGANDGSHSDPIYRFLMGYKQSTTALLIEPQPEIISYLEDAYADHPAASIYNGAIGAGKQLVLYRIRPDLWESFRVSYLKGAPATRRMSWRPLAGTWRARLRRRTPSRSSTYPAPSFGPCSSSAAFR